MEAFVQLVQAAARDPDAFEREAVGAKGISKASAAKSFSG
jgi:hypothetical protein